MSDSCNCALHRLSHVSGNYENRAASACFLVTFILAVATCLLPALAQAPNAERATTAHLTTEQQKKLKDRDHHGSEAQRLREEGKLEEAIEAAKKMMALEREVYGDAHEDVAGSLEFLADMHEQRESWDAARKTRQEILEVNITLLGKDHYQVTDARLALTNLERLAQLSPEERQRLSEAKQLNGQVVHLYRRSKHKTAIPLAQQALAVRKELLGEEHPAYALSLFNLAAQHAEMGDYAKAEPLHVKASEICVRVLGEEHPDYANSLLNLAALYQAKGDYAKAETLFVRTLKLRLDFARNMLPWLPEAQAMTFMRNKQIGRDPLLSAQRNLPGADHRKAYFAVWHTRALRYAIR